MREPGHVADEVIQIGSRQGVYRDTCDSEGPISALSRPGWSEGFDVISGERDDVINWYSIQ